MPITVNPVRDRFAAELSGIDLMVEHDVCWSRAQVGIAEFSQGEREQYPPPQRLVRTHPGSKRKRYICRPMPRLLSAGRWRMDVCCCWI